MKNLLWSLYVTQLKKKETYWMLLSMLVRFLNVYSRAEPIIVAKALTWVCVFPDHYCLWLAEVAYNFVFCVRGHSEVHFLNFRSLYAGWIQKLQQGCQPTGSSKGLQNGSYIHWLLALLFLLWQGRLGSLSNYGDDHNRQLQKAIGLMIKTTALHVHHAL